jgi:serine/threonine protein kinase
MIGGKVYRKTTKGTVEDTSCIYKDSKTFCKHMSTVLENVSGLTLFNSANAKFTLSDKKEIDDVIISMTRSSDMVTKTFKGSQPLKNFLHELNAYHEVMKILPNKKHHNIAPIMQFKSMPIFGLVLRYKDSRKPTYHIFSEGCSIKVLDMEFTPKLFSKFAKDITEVLDTLRSKGYCHNDIKPDNLYYCATTDRFKIVDWGYASQMSTTKPLSSMQRGSMFYSHPLKLYLSGLPSSVARRSMQIASLTRKEKWTRKLNSMIPLKSFGASSFDYIVNRYSNLSSLKLHNMYAPFYDNYSFALLLILLAEKNNIKAPKDSIDEKLAPFMPSYT